MPKRLVVKLFLGIVRIVGRDRDAIDGIKADP